MHILSLSAQLRRNHILFKRKTNTSAQINKDLIKNNDNQKKKMQGTYVKGPRFRDNRKIMANSAVVVFLLGLRPNACRNDAHSDSSDDTFCCKRILSCNKNAAVNYHNNHNKKNINFLSYT